MYHVANWDLTVQCVRSSIATSTACRSPGEGGREGERGWLYHHRHHGVDYHCLAGTLPAIFIVESIMDHVARTLNMDIEVVKKMNFYKQGDVCNY